MWVLKPLEGKYYGTKIVNWETGDEIEVWLTMGMGDYRASDREIENGWDSECGYDHVELQSSYDAAQKIVKALNADSD